MSGIRIRVLCIAILLFFSGWARCATPDEQHQAAIAEHKAGNTATALRRLDSLVAQYPQTNRFAYDLIAVAVAGGEFDQALAIAPRVASLPTPAFVEEALATAETATGQLDAARDRLQRLAFRFPDRCDAHVALGWLLDKQATREFLPHAERTRQLCPRAVSAIDQYAYALKQAGRITEALKQWQDLERLDPGNKAALAGRALALRQLAGSFKLSQTLQEHPTQDVEHEKGVLLLRWANAADSTNAYKGEDDALAQLRAAEDLAPEAYLPRQRFDQVVALTARKRYAQAVSLFKSMGTLMADTPAYVHQVLGESFLSLRQPEEALTHYEAALAAAPESRAARSGRVTALSSLHRDDEATQLAAAETKFWANTMAKEGPRGLVNVSDTMLAALQQEAWTTVYAEDYATGLKKFDTLVEEYPESTSSLLGAATAHRWAGHLNLARELALIAKGQAPADRGVMLEQAANARGQGDLVLARELTLKAIADRDLADPSFGRALREQEVAEMGELTLSFTLDGNRIANTTIRVESSDFGNWRIGSAQTLGHENLAEAYLKARVSDTTRVVAGARASGYREGAWVALENRIADGLRLDMQLTTMPDMPRKAVAARVTGSQQVIGLTWNPSTLDVVTSSFSASQFSDDNQMAGVSATWKHTYYVRSFASRYWVLGASVGQSSRGGLVAYYSPSFYSAAESKLGWRWLGARSYTEDRKTWHQVELGGGILTERGFGSAPLWSVDYQATLEFSDITRVGVSAGLYRRPYDGTAVIDPRGNVWLSRNF